MITYLKVGALAALLAAIFMAGWHLGGDSARTALASLQAAQAEDTAKAVLAERASAAAESARLQAILKRYDDAPIDPIALHVGDRVLEYARVAQCPVPKAGADPRGAASAAPVAFGASQVGRALDALTEACAQDAAELTALQAAWPR